MINAWNWVSSRLDEDKDMSFKLIRGKGIMELINRKVQEQMGTTESEGNTMENNTVEKRDYLTQQEAGQAMHMIGSMTIEQLSDCMGVKESVIMSTLRAAGYCSKC